MSQPSLDAVLRCMRRAVARLRDNLSIPFSDLMTLTVEELAKETVIPAEPHGDYRGAWHRLRDTPLSYLLVEAYTQIHVLGYIIPQPSPPTPPNLNWYRVTQRGRDWTNDLRPAPEDSEGYLAALRVEVPEIDSIVVQYVEEAVVTFNRRAWFATAVMVGAASEKLLYLLSEALLRVTGGTQGKALQKAIGERNIPKLLNEITKTIERHKHARSIPYPIEEGVKQHLLSLFEAIRVQRNEAVHPAIGKVTPESVRLTLSAFPGVCRKVYDLLGWCAGGTTPTERSKPA
jgi:hypothetical protein